MEIRYDDLHNVPCTQSSTAVLKWETTAFFACPYAESWPPLQVAQISTYTPHKGIYSFLRSQHLVNNQVLVPLLLQKENEELTAVATAAPFEIFHLSMDVHSSSLSFEKGINQSKYKHLAAYKPRGYK